MILDGDVPESPVQVVIVLVMEPEPEPELPLVRVLLIPVSPTV